jgi:hypothetical protein
MIIDLGTKLNKASVPYFGTEIHFSGEITGKHENLTPEIALLTDT